MKEELQTALAELIQKTIQGAGSTKTFLIKEIPDVLNQLLMWHGWYNFILFLTGILIFILIIIFNRKQYKWIKKGFNEKGIDWADDKPYLMCNAFQFIWIIPYEEFLNLTWLQIWIAPKVWLIEYMTKLVK